MQASKRTGGWDPRNPASNAAFHFHGRLRMKRMRPGVKSGRDCGPPGRLGAGLAAAAAAGKLRGRQQGGKFLDQTRRRSGTLCRGRRGRRRRLCARVRRSSLHAPVLRRARPRPREAATRSSLAAIGMEIPAVAWGSRARPGAARPEAGAGGSPGLRLRPRADHAPGRPACRRARRTKQIAHHARRASCP